MPRGKPAPIPSGADQRSNIDGSLGDANMQPRGIGFGKVTHGGDAGMHDAEYRTFGTSQAKGQVYEVQHSLGHKPGFAILVKAENLVTPTSHYMVNAYEYDKWNETTVRVHVYTTGSLDNAQLTLLIGGSQ